jgi:ribosomal protein S18 acetylase RimI-like enzyme
VIEVRPLEAADAPWNEAALRRAWGSRLVARYGELVDALPLDGFVAVDGNERVGLLTYAVRRDELEVVSIHADREGEGIGRALMDAAGERARQLGVRRLWLVTTNDNVRAIRFYQRWGMDLVAVHRDEVERSRAVKPSIPLTGFDGVPIRHELEFELILSPGR